MTRVAVIFNPGNPAMGPTMQAVESSAASLGLDLEPFAVREPPEFERAFVTIARNRYTTASPGEIPVERPTSFELVINRRTAKAIGVDIAPSILLRADRVID